MTTIEMTGPSATPTDAERARLLPRANRVIQMPSFHLDERLTKEQIEFLDTYGFIRFKAFATKAKVRELIEEIEAVDRQIISEGRTQINGVPLIIGTKKDGTRFVQRMVFSSLFSPKLAEFIRDPRFKSILEIAGPGYRIGERERDGLVVNHFRHEEGSSYKKLGWHTDSLRDIFYFEKPRKYLNVGFYFDDSPVTKGGVRLLPFTHKQPIAGLLTHKMHFLDNEPDEDEYAIEAEAGDLTIHDGRIWHRVAQATLTGDASTRRVMYLPLMDGPLKEKNENSSAPLYLKLRKLAGHG